MDYEKKYKDLVEAVKELQEANPSDEGIQKWVEDNIPELAESKDEKIRKLIIKHFKEIANSNGQSWISLDIHYILDWLEEQGEHANFRNKIQIGDKVTRNEDGVLVNLSQLNRVAKKDEKQGEHKTAEWSEEDEKMLDYALDMIEWYSVIDKSKSKRVSDWLKSLRPHSQWKPSDEQMKALDDAISSRDIKYDVLSELWEDLNKLK